MNEFSDDSETRQCLCGAVLEAGQRQCRKCQARAIWRRRRAPRRPPRNPRRRARRQSRRER
jgi:hypothetical protein